MHASRLSWSDIQASLPNLQPVEGGYSNAQRGLVSLPLGKTVFVKIGVSDDTKAWANREILNYRILHAHDYPYIPKLLAYNAGETGFAIEPLAPNNGWNWTNVWSKERLTATLQAMDALTALALTTDERRHFDTSTINESQDGWNQLVANIDSQHILRQKLYAQNQADLADLLDIPAAAARSASFVFRKDALVHNDVRADNCAWSPALQQVRLVDWNWAQLGDRRIDVGALLVNVRKTGLDVVQLHADRLDGEALHWLAGYWLNAATRPLWPGAPEKSTLRDYQLQSGITALELLGAVEA